MTRKDRELDHLQQELRSLTDSVLKTETITRNSLRSTRSTASEQHLPRSLSRGSNTSIRSSRSEKQKRQQPQSVSPASTRARRPRMELKLGNRPQGKEATDRLYRTSTFSSSQRSRGGEYTRASPSRRWDESPSNSERGRLSLNSGMS
jgi:hypothetical protein